MTFWRRYRNLTIRRLSLSIEAFLHIAVARFALRVLPYRVYERLLRTRSIPAVDTHAAIAREVGWIVQRVAGIIPWRSDCLIQATAAQWMLRRRKVPTRLHIGVAPAHSAFSAHAWLSHESTILTGRPGHTRFQTIRIY